MDGNKKYGLIMVTGTNRGVVYNLDYGPNSLGRHSSNNVCLSSEGLVVSKKHAVLTIEPGKITIQDCNSTNGLYVNGTRTTLATIIVGDIIGFGEGGPRFQLTIPTPPKESTELKCQKPLPDSPTPEHNPIPDKSQTGLSVHSVTPSPLPPENHESSLWNDLPLPLIGPDTTKKHKSTISRRSVSTGEIERWLVSGGKNREEPNGHPFTATQESFLLKCKKIYHRRRRIMYGAGGGIIFALCVIVIYYATGYYRYEQLFSRSKIVREETVTADREYERMRQSDTVDLQQKQHLLEKLRNREATLDSLMAQLPRRYRQRFFSDSIEYFLHEIMSSLNEPYYRVPSHMLGKVKYYVDRFSNNPRVHDALHTRWRSTFFPYIDRTFRMYHVPSVLAYIAIQESLLDTLAISRAGARGLWQFMPATGRQYGLRIDRHRDERIEWQKATEAAARYLHDLLAEFGDGKAVLLAVAAYNTGGANVRRALRGIRDPLRDRDFWYLYRTSDILANETREYVPQVLARMVVDFRDKRRKGNIDALPVTIQ